jgi:hypothetical protein
MTFIADSAAVADPTLIMDHVIITRFNLPTPGREQGIRSREGWLRNRVELFETYCEPSVERQTEQNFSWLIYFDPDSPDWLKDWLRDRHHRFTPVFRASVSHSELIEDLRRISGESGSILATTNLDNDDGLAPDFVARVQSAVVGTGRQAVYLTRGVIMHGTGLYLHTDRLNAFCSVTESWEDPVTAWADWHNLLGRSMPVVQQSGAPAWLQVVHGSNVSNRVHGRRVHPRNVAAVLPPAQPTPPDPGRVRCLAENVAVRPLRSLRTAGRSTLRRALIRAVGRDGFDQLKNTAAALPRRLRRAAEHGSVVGRQSS